MKLDPTVPGDHDGVLGQTELGPDLRAPPRAPTPDVDRVGDPGDTFGGEAVAADHAVGLRLGGDDQRPRRPHADRAHDALEPRARTIATLECSDDGHAEDAPQSRANVEALVLVLLAEDRVGAHPA